ncbi:hypothetical protein SK137_1993 [Streptococcus mitis]|uniref:Gp35 n=1 Tax=Streptococcus mitis TaxID=28037 RepID=A0A081PN65_STRMT|nr:hypothetical protein [Streptococcus mitis]KEQ32138.1 hypothetical protein SK137_1993 [Streptococcus mitis]KJQ73372.1 hypothetical protein TZ91_00980 [Streptococcus mitis]QBX26566.1 hypothetical protein Javan330_0029 [Streptococcus phage Javan330]
MEHDVLPSILKEVQERFERDFGKSEIVRNAFAALKGKKATYKTANEFAIEIGDILSKALGTSLRADKLPDGKMYYNIAQRLLTDVLGRNHELVSGYTSDVQKNLNQEAKIGLKVQVPELNLDRIAGIVNRFSSEENFEDVSWLLGEPIVNFTQSIIDDSIQKNAEFHHQSGLQPEIVRKSYFHCCEWCQEVQGSYKYPRVPKDVYRRHQHCRCILDYDPKSGKTQNVWTKKWNSIDKERVERRKLIGVVSVDEREQKRYNRVMKSSGAVYGAWNDRNDPYNKERDRHAQKFYESVRNRNKQHEIVKVSNNSGLSQSDVEKIYNHIFINEYDLEDGRKRFDPSYDMAESWRRLSEIGGKNIQPHDLVMLNHELMEHDLMAKGMKYDEAHELTNKTYNYQKAWIAWMKEKGDL